MIQRSFFCIATLIGSALCIGANADTSVMNPPPQNYQQVPKQVPGQVPSQAPGQDSVAKPPMNAPGYQGSTSTQAAEKIRWLTSYSEALQQAKQQNKPLFLYFTGSDWCGWCKKMESEVFATREFASMSGNRFIFVMLDFPMNKQLAPELKKQNQELKEKYGVTGYPTVILVDPNENFIAESGYRPGGGAAYSEYINSLKP